MIASSQGAEIADDSMGISSVGAMLNAINKAPIKVAPKSAMVAFSRFWFCGA